MTSTISDQALQSVLDDLRNRPGTGELIPVIDPATGRPASEGAGAARTEAPRAAGTGPAQAAAEAEPSTEAGSARG